MSSLLWCGYTVVAVEADPRLVLAARQRFTAELKAGRLQIVPAAVSDTVGSIPFWIDQAQNGANSSLLANSPRSRGERTSITVDTITLADLIMQYGTPYYIKVDIEGAERLALSTLVGERPPRWLSAEINSDDLFTALSALGYGQFQVIDQAFIGDKTIEQAGRTWQFTADSSGPFGAELPVDKWQPLDQAKASYHQQRREHPDGWFDLHAAL